MGLAMNLAKMTKGGNFHAGMEETQYLIKIPQADVQEKKICGVEFPGHHHVKAVTERCPAMLWEN